MRGRVSGRRDTGSHTILAFRTNPIAHLASAPIRDKHTLFASDPVGMEDSETFYTRLPPPPDESQAWVARNEVVRDLHRAAVQPRIPSSKSADACKRLLYTEIGTASDLAQPGGFRRAHVVQEADPGGSTAIKVRRATPLLQVLEREGFFATQFITRVVERLEDGTEVRYESRPYRRGARPRIVRSESGLDLIPAVRLRFIGFRPLSVPYWATSTFLLGALLFSFGSFYWMAVPLGGVVSVWLMTYPFFLGGLGFLSGCYLAFVEVINANLQEDIALGLLSPEGSVHRQTALLTPSRPTPETMVSSAGVGKAECGRAGPPSPISPVRLKPIATTPARTPEPRERADSAAGTVGFDGETCGDFLSRLHWWRVQPKSLLWWGALVQLLGACCFQVCLTADLPSVRATMLVGTDGGSSYMAEVWWIYLPSTLGSIGFTFASYVYLLEVAQDPTRPWSPPAGTRERLGYANAVLNLVGSALFLLASLCYFVTTESEVTQPGSLVALLEYLGNEWGLRFGFGVGSVCFAIGAVLAYPEALSDLPDPEH